MKFSTSIFRCIYHCEKSETKENQTVTGRQQIFRLLTLTAPCLSLFALLFASQAFGQDITENTRRIIIGPLGDTEYSVEVGQTLSGIGVVKLDPGFWDPSLTDLMPPPPVFSNSAYTLWRVEPASAARIIQPMPISPASATIDIEFLQATVVTITASGFDEEGGGDEIDDTNFTEVAFTFTVVESSQAPGTDQSTASLLNDNQRSAQSGLERTCSAIQSLSPTSRTNGQNQLLDTCDELATQVNPRDGLDRIVADELFALSDALTITSDQNIGNIQSRINRLRVGQSETFDLQSLHLDLWNQTIGGAVLSSHMHELVPNSGGSASQDVIEQSALGLFAGGNISLGEIDGKGRQHDADISTNSLTLGADYRVDTQRVFGVALGVVNDHTDFKGDNGNMDMQGFNLSAFGTWYEQSKGYADIIAEISQNDFELSRRINLVGQDSEFANSSTGAMRMAVSINLGATFQRGRTEFGPVGRMAMTRASIDGFSEISSIANGGVGTELNVKSHTVTSLRIAAGGEVKHVISLSNAVFIPTARLELELETETDKGTIAATFVNDPDNNKMEFSGARRSSNAMLISIGTTAVFKNGQSAFVSLETRAMDDHISQNRVRLGYRMHF